MRRPQGPIGGDKSEVIAEIPAACSDERAAVEFMERQRWGDAPKCPRCDSAVVYQMRDRKTGARNARYLWRCHGCKKQYTVRVGMICEDSKIPLRFWCYAFWRICSSKKGVSSLQIKRETGLTYRSAYFLMARVRWAMREDHATPPKLEGVVEVDETYVGGKPRYKRHGQGSGYAKGAMDKKGQVVALLERGGSVRALVHKRSKGYTFKDIIRERVDPSAVIYTDEAQRYVGLHREFAGHESVRHRTGEDERHGEEADRPREGLGGRGEGRDQQEEARGRVAEATEPEGAARADLAASPALTRGNYGERFQTSRPPGFASGIHSRGKARPAQDSEKNDQAPRPALREEAMTMEPRRAVEILRGHQYDHRESHEAMDLAALAVECLEADIAYIQNTERELNKMYHDRWYELRRQYIAATRPLSLAAAHPEGKHD